MKIIRKHKHVWKKIGVEYINTPNGRKITGTTYNCTAGRCLPGYKVVAK